MTIETGRVMVGKGVRGGGEATLGFDDLYRRYAPPAYRLAFVLSGDPEVARDLVQDAFVRVIGRFGHLRSQTSFDAYLRRTIINLALSHGRRRTLERRNAFAESVSSPPPGHDVESRVDLWQLLLRLPTRQRAAVVLRYYEDLSEQQTADTLGTSPRAVNSLVSRALVRLRELEGSQQWTD
jgi:RNA polymerase sigma-70 factor (sigma-E family)